MIDVGAIGGLVAAGCTVGALWWSVSRGLKKARQEEIAEAVKDERERLERDHELANALQRIAELERQQHPRHRRSGDGTNDAEARHAGDADPAP